MLEKLNRLFGKKEAEKMAAMKPDEPDQPRTYSADLKTWMGEAKAEGLDGETGGSSYEVAAGELHAKFDAVTAKQMADKKTHDHPHLELVENKPNKPVATVKEVKNPFVAEAVNDNQEKEGRLLDRLNSVQADVEKSLAEIAAIRKELELLKAKKRVEVA